MYLVLNSSTILAPKHHEGLICLGANDNQKGINWPWSTVIKAGCFLYSFLQQDRCFQPLHSYHFVATSFNWRSPFASCSSCFLYSTWTSPALVAHGILPMELGVCHNAKFLSKCLEGAKEENGKIMKRSVHHISRRI